jgi:uncharacterized protein
MKTLAFFRAAAVGCALLFTIPAHAASSDAQKALAQELLGVIRVDQQIERMTALTADQTAQFMQQSRPEMTAEEAKVYGEAYANALKLNIGDLVNDIANTYADEYSEDELKQIIAFYKSPVGQKYLDKAPELSRRAAAVGQAWQQKNEHPAQSLAAEEMKKHGFKNW